MFAYTPIHSNVKCELVFVEDIHCCCLTKKCVDFFLSKMYLQLQKKIINYTRTLAIVIKHKK